MKHFELKHSFWGNLSVRRLEKLLGSDGLISLLKLCSWAAEHCLAGSVFAGMDAKDIELAAEWQGEPGMFFEAALNTRCLQRFGDTCALRDWDRELREREQEISEDGKQ